MKHLPNIAGSPFRYEIIYLLVKSVKALKTYHIIIKQIAIGLFNPIFGYLFSIKSFFIGRYSCKRKSSSLSKSEQNNDVSKLPQSIIDNQ